MKCHNGDFKEVFSPEVTFWRANSHGIFKTGCFCGFIIFTEGFSIQEIYIDAKFADGVFFANAVKYSRGKTLSLR